MAKDIILKTLEEVSILTAKIEGWNDKIRLAVLDDYISFLDDCASGVSRKPTQAVDKLWHRHILNTQLYLSFTHQRYGKYIHHIACVPDEHAYIFNQKNPRDYLSLNNADPTGLYEVADCSDSDKMSLSLSTDTLTAYADCSGTEQEDSPHEPEKMTAELDYA